MEKHRIKYLHFIILFICITYSFSIDWMIRYFNHESNYTAIRFFFDFFFIILLLIMARPPKIIRKTLIFNKTISKSSELISKGLPLCIFIFAIHATLLSLFIGNNSDLLYSTIGNFRLNLSSPPEYQLQSLFMIVILVPIFEEVFLRYSLLNVLIGIIPKGPSIIIVSVLSLLFHFFIDIPLFFVSLFCSLLYIKTKDLRISIIFHMIFNVIVLFILSGREALYQSDYGILPELVFIPLFFFIFLLPKSYKYLKSTLHQMNK